MKNNKEIKKQTQKQLLGNQSRDGWERLVVLEEIESSQTNERFK